MWLVSGVNYGAYGNGDKPAFYGSKQDYSDASWKSEGNNVYSLYIGTTDSGAVILNDSVTGVKRFDIADLGDDGDFYHNLSTGVIYLYSTVSIDSYDSVEISRAFDMIAVTNRKNIHIDNLSLKYGARHGISGSNAESITVTNCEISYIGGMGTDIDGRLGNGIEFFSSAKDITVENCYISQCYDAGFTFQGKATGDFENISFTDNLVEYCHYGIEFFNYDSDDLTKSGKYKDITISDNIISYTGYGFGSYIGQRKYWISTASICGWKDGILSCKNFKIKDNIFNRTLGNFVYWKYNSLIDDSNIQIYVSGNSFYQSECTVYTSDLTSLYKNGAINYGYIATVDTDNQTYATDTASLEIAIGTFDKNAKNILYFK